MQTDLLNSLGVAPSLLTLPINHLDSGLLALGAQLDAIWNAALGDIPANVEASRIIALISEAQAFTLEGLKVKVRALAFLNAADPINPDYEDGKLIASMSRDVIPLGNAASLLAS